MYWHVPHCPRGVLFVIQEDYNVDTSFFDMRLWSYMFFLDNGHIYDDLSFPRSHSYQVVATGDTIRVALKYWYRMELIPDTVYYRVGDYRPLNLRR